jgi:hypothetical protein
MKSLKRLRKRLPRYFYESRTRYFYKLYGRLGLLAANLCWTAGRMVSLIRNMVQKNHYPLAFEAQWRDIWINFWNPLGAYTHPQNTKNEDA